MLQKTSSQSAMNAIAESMANLTDPQQHPLSAAFPAMTDSAFAELRADIAQNGLRYPIVLFQMTVLDGWHRKRACKETGTALRFEEFDGDDDAARRFVVSVNLMRRHLDVSQRSMVGGRLANMPLGGAQYRSVNLPTGNGTAQSDAAALVNVSTKSITDARTVLGSGDAELIDKVDSGGIAVSNAAKQVRASRPAKKARAQKPRGRIAPGTAIQIEPQTVEQWAVLSDEAKHAHLAYRDPGATLNAQKAGEDDNLIDWARWTWNPITGCNHNCPYCYARDIAERFSGTATFPDGFKPMLRADRLAAPLNTKPRLNDDPRERRIFTGSMTDVFGRWVPVAWIQSVLDVTAQATQWRFLMLTKFPKRMAEFDIPGNVWAGTSVDCQSRVAAAEEAFSNIKAEVRWLSCEPLIEPLKFKHLDRFNLLVIGGASPSSATPRWIPPFSWLDDLMRQADDVGCAVFLKSNLYRKEQPGAARYAFSDRAPRVFHYLAQNNGRRRVEIAQ